MRCSDGSYLNLEFVPVLAVSPDEEPDVYRVVAKDVGGDVVHVLWGGVDKPTASGLVRALAVEANGGPPALVETSGLPTSGASVVRGARFGKPKVTR